MKCYDCDKYLKKGHGKNLYHYAGQWRYYCFFCLKLDNYHYQIRSKSGSYYNGLFLFSLSLMAFTWVAAKYLTKSPWNNWITHHLAIAIIPTIIIYLLISNLIIKPKVKAFKEELWIPLEKEQEKLKAMESYVNSLNKNKDYCYCEKCLEIEWNKKKKTNYQ